MVRPHGWLCGIAEPSSGELSTIVELLEHACLEGVNPHFSECRTVRSVLGYVHSMRKHTRIRELISDATAQRRCVHSSVRSEAAALQRRAQEGEELIRVAPGYYAPREYWQDLRPPDRTLHLARAVGMNHPQWVFTGAAAAAAYGLEHQWTVHDGTLAITDAKQNDFCRGSGIRRLYMPVGYMQPVEVVHGIRVPGVVQTVLDCARLFEFCNAIPVADSALARGMKYDELLSGCIGLNGELPKVMRVLNHADGASENGGESLARATIIEGGYDRPLLQMPFVDPESGRCYRADFVWVLPDGSIVIGEFDGTGKYVDPLMTDRKSIQATVHLERERETALRRAGARMIVRFTYDDVVRRTPLWRKLAQAGVPRSDSVRG